MKFITGKRYRLHIYCNGIYLFAIIQKSLDRAISLYIFIHEVRVSGVRASISIVHIRKFCYVVKCNEISFDPDFFLE